MVDTIDLSQSTNRPRVLLFGLNNDTTVTVLQGLLSAGIRPLGLLLPDTAAPHLVAAGQALSVVPPADRSLSILTLDANNHISQQACAADLPVYVVADLNADATISALSELKADIGVVACFSRKIPQRVRELFPWGPLNIHPSLLPAYRGPSPLFWQFRAGETAFGVTIHMMDDGFDTGDIVAQKAVNLAGGVPEHIATQQLAKEGVSLLVQALRDIECGKAISVPQTPGGSTYGWPTDDDFIIDATWTARRAFDFVQSTAEWGRPYRIVVGGETLLIAEALATADIEMEGVIYYESDGTAWIRLSDGAIQVSLL